MYPSAFAERSKALSENKALRDELYKLRDYQKESRLMELKLSRLEQLLNSPNETRQKLKYKLLLVLMARLIVHL